MVLNFPLHTISGKPPHPYLSKQKQEYGAADLAEVAYRDMEGLQGSGVHWNRSFTKDDLIVLLKAAFLASLSTYEGRSPRCSILLDNQPCGEIETFAFANAIELTADQLRKYAPLCQRNGCALRVEKRHSGLHLAGLSVLRFEGLDLDLGMPAPRRQVYYETNFQIHILAPGQIRVDNGIFEYELDCGRVRQCLPLWDITPIRQLCNHFVASVKKELTELEVLSDKQKRLFPIVASTVVCENLVESILQQVIASGFGGAILVIPSELLQIVKSQLQTLNGDKCIDLLDAVVEQSLAALLCHDAKSGQLSLDETKLQRLSVAQAHTILAAKTIADLCAVDGCVVLDELLRVQGFGVKINTTRDAAIASPIAFKKCTDGTEVDFEGLENLGGTRWRSSVWFCKANHAVTTFIISQDRNLKVCWSDHENAYAYGPLTLPTRHKQ